MNNSPTDFDATSIFVSLHLYVLWDVLWLRKIIIQLTNTYKCTPYIFEMARKNGYPDNIIKGIQIKNEKLRKRVKKFDDIEQRKKPGDKRKSNASFRFLSTSNWENNKSVKETWNFIILHVKRNPRTALITIKHVSTFFLKWRKTTLFVMGYISTISQI